MIATLKRTLVIFIGLICTEILIFSSFNTFAIANETPLKSKETKELNASDITYIPEDNIAPETTTEEDYQEADADTYDYTLSDYNYTDDYSDNYNYEYNYYNYTAPSSSGNYISEGEWVSGSDFQIIGAYHDDNWGYTYYSEKVLPGGGLDIPGRHTDAEGYVCDINGNICVASDDLAPGTVVDLPFGSGTGIVYDSGSGNGNLDIFTSWS